MINTIETVDFPLIPSNFKRSFTLWYAESLTKFLLGVLLIEILLWCRFVRKSHWSSMHLTYRSMSFMLELRSSMPFKKNENLFKLQFKFIRISANVL